MSEVLVNQIIGSLNAVADGKPYLLYKFPEHKHKIKGLTLDQKQEWYGYQFELNPHNAIVMGTQKEFKDFWKWQVLIPIKIIRTYYRIKNFQLFKRYKHITEMKPKNKQI